MDKYVPGIVPESRPVIGMGVVLLIGAVVVAAFCLMVLGALKLGELVRAVW